ncbi:MAG: hypothetical protein NC302_05875 [Bacteroidales bacterium]|nr:hypothetical protein [Bacteroidales bacterium]MCM1416736.1 hypothetical protein [bacterium]MCM1424757.1 hypothetical protein [bacterium]
MKGKLFGCVRVIVFVLGFCLIFWQLQEILHHRWDHTLYDANIYMQEQPENAYDVFFIGTSELKTAVYPGGGLSDQWDYRI